MLALTFLEKPLWMWLAFLGVVLVLVVFDLGVLQRTAKEITIRASLRLSAFYVSMGVLFGAFVWWQLGAQAGKDYYTGFVIEKSLSMDNIFVISLVFSYFAIPRLYQYGVLFWGVIGVIILRGLLIGIGADLVEDFDWMMYVFSAFLIFTGIRMLFAGEHKPDIESNAMLRFLKKHVRVTDELHGKRFMLKLPDASGRLRLFITPLLVSLLVVEFVDLVFAVDSVPAIFAVTTDEYVVYTSNIFAILGLRALYFTLAAMIHRFTYLNYSLAAILIFIGGKIFLPPLLGWNEFPHSLSLGITLGILALGIGFSLYKTQKTASIQP
jgi:tellurite resistance protein TerC